MELRPYQSEALDRLHNHVCTQASNPCIVLPTGSGKSLCIAEAIRRWRSRCPWFRCIILAHRKELIAQNAAELEKLGVKRVGIFSAAIGRRDYEADILYASIDSVYRRAGDFAPWHVIMVDEAHRIPLKGEGKYRRFIKESRRWNHNLRVVGWTATPYRLGGGQICHKDHILNQVCYEANVCDLIEQGYLCQLRSKAAKSQPALEGVRRHSGGDYVTSSLAEAVDRHEVVEAAVAEAAAVMQSEGRQAALVYCVDIKHCELVHHEFRKHGIFAPIVTAKTPQHTRAKIAQGFLDRRVRALLNVNIYTEGFNARHVDYIVLLRPTLSAGLYAQMVGRGLRTHPDKGDCLVMDFARCIETHGPIDAIDGRPVPTVVCRECCEVFSRAIDRCPQCGWVVPKQVVERAEAEARKRRLHDASASNAAILSRQPKTLKVDQVFLSRHRKESKPDSLKVQYRCGTKMFREWVCLGHTAYPLKKAHDWWRRRFPDRKPPTVSEVLQDLWTAQELLDWTKTITVKKNGKYYEIVDYNLPED